MSTKLAKYLNIMTQYCQSEETTIGWPSPFLTRHVGVTRKVTSRDMNMHSGSYLSELSSLIGVLVLPGTLQLCHELSQV